MYEFEYVRFVIFCYELSFVLIKLSILFICLDQKIKRRIIKIEIFFKIYQSKTYKNSHLNLINITSHNKQTIQIYLYLT
mgnify:CR=1 FL=1